MRRRAPKGGVASWFEAFLAPASPDAAKGQPPWQERMLAFLLVLTAAAGFPAAVAAAIAAFRGGNGARPLLTLASYALILLLALLPRRFSFGGKATLLLLVPLTLGTVSLAEAGLAGSGQGLLMAFPAAAALLFGLRGGALAWAISLAAFAGIGSAITQGWLASGPGVASDTGSWLAAGGVLSLVGGALTVGIGSLRDRLAEVVSRQEEWLAKSSRERQELEVRVAEGARGLMRHTLQLQTTAEIARLAAQKLEPHDLLSRAVELIREKFGFYHSSAFLIDQTGTWAELAASTGEVGGSLLQRGFRLAVGSSSLVGWTTANRQTRLALDVDQDPFYFRNPLLPDTRAELVVPLVVADRLLGALDVQSVEPEAFSQDDLRALEAIAGEVAVALDTAQQLVEVRRELEDAQGVVRGRVRASWTRLARQELPGNIRIAASGEAILGGAPDLPTMRQAEASAQRMLSEDGREMAVPIVVRGEVLATVGVRRAGSAERWSEDDIGLLEAVAGQAAMALENARQTAEEQRRLAELEVINRVSQAVSQMLPLDSLFKVVHAQINQILGDVGLTYAFYDPVTGEVSRPYVSERGEAKSLPSAHLGDDLISYIIRSQTPLLLGRDLAGQAAQLGARLDDSSLRSWLGVPMVVGEDVVGAIAVSDKERDERFTEDDAALLSTISSQVAAAFQNMRLLEQVQRSARRERLIHEIATKVRRAPDFRTILETTTRELGRALNAARASVRLGENGGEEPSGESPPSPPRSTEKQE